MLYVAMIFFIIMIVLMFTPFYERFIDMKDLGEIYILAEVVLTLVIVVSGIVIDNNNKPSEVNDFNVCDSSEVYNIKDFSYTIVSSKGNTKSEEKDNILDSTDYDNNATYDFVYCDTNKKDSIKSDSKTMIVFDKSLSNNNYTKLTVKTKEVFRWATFTHKTYKQYIFS